MAKQPTVIANQKSRPVRVSSTGREAAVPKGDGTTGEVRQVGTGNTAVPTVHKPQPETGPMVVRPAKKLEVKAMPPNVVEAVNKGRLSASKAHGNEAAAWSTKGLDFDDRLARLRRVNQDLKARIKPLDTQPDNGSAPARSAMSRTMANLARRVKQ